VGLPRGNFSQELRHAHRSPAGHQPVAERIVWAEIDREARKGKPIPSDHAPVVIDLDQPGRPIDAGWAGASDASRSAAPAESGEDFSRANRESRQLRRQRRLPIN
jgi:hypothetical protein